MLTTANPTDSAQPQLQGRLSAPTDSDEALRAMVFDICQDPTAVTENRFALPLEAIVKIIRCPAQLGVFRRGISILEIEQQTVTVVDLCYRLQPDRPTDPADRRFLMLVQTHSGDLCGIPVATFPSLIDLPVTMVQPIPPVYRKVHDIRFASHMVNMTKADQTERILLIGMNHLLVEKLSLLMNNTQRQPLELKAALN